MHVRARTLDHHLHTQHHPSPWPEGHPTRSTHTRCRPSPGCPPVLEQLKHHARKLASGSFVTKLTPTYAGVHYLSQSCAPLSVPLFPSSPRSRARLSPPPSSPPAHHHLSLLTSSPPSTRYFLTSTNAEGTMLEWDLIARTEHMEEDLRPLGAEIVQGTRHLTSP